MYNDVWMSAICSKYVQRPPVSGPRPSAAFMIYHVIDYLYVQLKEVEFFLFGKGLEASRLEASGTAQKAQWKY